MFSHCHVITLAVIGAEYSSSYSLGIRLGSLRCSPRIVTAQIEPFSGLLQNSTLDLFEAPAIHQKMVYS